MYSIITKSILFSLCYYNAFAFTTPGFQHAFTTTSGSTRSTSSSTTTTRLYETVEEVNTLLRSATIYGEKVADENIR